MAKGLAVAALRIGLFRRGCHAATYRRLHVLYFVILSVAGALLLWALPEARALEGDRGDRRRLKAEDAIFNAVSALSVTGLASVEMHRFSMPQFVLMLFLMVLGSQVFTSAIPLFIRRYASARSISRSFIKLPETMIPEEILTAAAAAPFRVLDKKLLQASSPAMARPRAPKYVRRAASMPSLPIYHHRGATASPPPPEVLEGDVSFLPQPSPPHQQQQVLEGEVPCLPQPSPPPSPPPQTQLLQGDVSCLPQPSPLPPPPQTQDLEKHDLFDPPPSSPTSPAAIYNGDAGSHPIPSPFVEQEALAILSWLVVAYFATAQALGFLIVTACVEGSPHAAGVLQERGVNSAFFALFTTVSSFANAGFVPLDDNLMAMRRELALLLVLCGMILTGNTLYAPTMRAAIWALHKVEEGGGEWGDWLRRKCWGEAGGGKRRRRIRRAAALRYLLESPRRCFTHLFPRWETRWLVATVVALNGVQMAAITALEWGGDALAEAADGGRNKADVKLVDAFFSSVTTRNAGMNVVNIAAFSAPTLLLSLLMMYVAVYPVYLSRETSKESMPSHASHPPISKVQMMSQFRKLLARDSLYLFVATFFICLTERTSIRQDPVNFSIFNILFEVISAYGNVGLSLGYSCSLQVTSKGTCVDVPYSFSGKWSTLGKLILTVVMLLGRHRGLPDDLDWAITLPSYE